MYIENSMLLPEPYPIITEGNCTWCEGRGYHVENEDEAAYCDSLWLCEHIECEICNGTGMVEYES